LRRWGCRRGVGEVTWTGWNRVGSLGKCIRVMQECVVEEELAYETGELDWTWWNRVGALGKWVDWTVLYWTGLDWTGPSCNTWQME
uniref:Polyprotein n=1 Tax=Hymenolepis diminuta TaxID=6216 RepID=A0A0R3SZN6_HYMDI